MSMTKQPTPQGKGKRGPFNKPKTSANDGMMYEFLPAAIEVERTPSSKAGRAIIWLIVLLFVIACLWAVFGKIDIVAVAQGKVIPSEAVKQIQALETARIKAIHVKEGDIVEQGQSLIELDNSLVQAELFALEAELLGVDQSRERLFQLAGNLDRLDSTTKNINISKSDGEQASFSLNAMQQAQLAHEIAEINAQIASLSNEEAKLLIEQKMAKAEIDKKQKVLPVLSERVDAFDTLRQKSYGSKIQYLELKQELIEEQQDLSVQQARLEQLVQQTDSMATQKALYLAEKRKQVAAELNGLQVQHDALTQQVSKARQRLAHYSLTAPTNGQVQQLQATTIDGVAQSAQPIMQIVPIDSELEVEVMILNKDIGFVEEGQRVAVKVDTFNFTKYGMLEGTLRHISDDAISDEQLGLIYTARVALEGDQLSVEGRQIRLSPGMAITAEVKTGQRRLIEFFLSPLLRYKQESLGER
jgi:hemolysin D